MANKKFRDKTPMGRYIGKFPFSSIIEKKFDRIIITRAIKVEGIDFDFEPQTQSEEWFINKDESYQPNKSAFIVGRFKETFPNVSLNKDDDVAYGTITSLASRSKAISEWLAINNASYAEDAQLPRFYEDIISPSDWKRLQDNISSYNKGVAEVQRKKQQAADEYKSKLKEIDEQFNKTKYMRVDERVKALTLGSNSLPLSLQTAILNYTPSKDDAPSQKAYARELLVRFKMYLIKKINDEKDFKVDQAVKDYQTK